MHRSLVRLRNGVATILVILIAALAVSAAASETVTPVADAPWLADRLSDPGVRVLDIRGEAYTYDAGHIPGAAFLNKAAIAELLDGTPGAPPDADSLAAIFRAAGVSDSSTVVIYDGTMGVWAARVFWVLEYLGHDDVGVLDGGWAKWVCGALPTATGAGTSTRPPGDLTPEARDSVLATKEWILGKLGDPDVVLLDVRSPAEYSGEELMSERGGRIPGAVNLEWTSLLDEDGSGAFLPMERMREALAAAGVTPDREVVIYCQVGGRAAHTYLALRKAGFDRVRLYEGSWAEWGNDPATPIELAP